MSNKPYWDKRGRLVMPVTTDLGVEVRVTIDVDRIARMAAGRASTNKTGACRYLRGSITGRALK